MSNQLLLLSPSDIAELAQVSRPVVSNWRKRHEDFPIPAGGTDARPLFARDEVVSWLEGRGHQVHMQSADAEIWSALNMLRGEASAGTAARLVLVLALLKKNAPDQFSGLMEHREKVLPLIIDAEKDFHPAYHGAPAPELPSPFLKLTLEEVLPVISAISKTGRDELATAVDLVLERLNRAQVRSGGDSGFIGSRISTLLASFASRTEGTVYDPASGIANVLVQVARKGNATRLVGSDIDHETLITAAQRALLHDVEIELHASDVLATDPVPELAADVVVLEPPFGARWDPSSALSDPRFSYGIPSRSRSELAWVQHALAHLTSEGRAYVVTTPGAAGQGGAEQQIREKLLLAGAVEAVIGLPARMLPQTSIPLTLWVLRNPQEELEDILFIDASEVERAEDKVVEWLHPTETFLPNIEAPHIYTPVTKVVEGESNLTPARWVGEVEVNEEDIINSFHDTSQRVNETLGHLEKVVISFSSIYGLHEPRINSITDLIENKVVELYTGRARMPSSAAAAERADIVRPIDVRRNQLSVTEDNTLFNEPDRTQPGDVLVSTVGKIVATVDQSGNRLLANGVERLRVLNPSVINPEYLAFSIQGSWNERFQRGTHIMRTSIRSLEIPLLPLEEQKRAVQVSQQLNQLRELARQLETQSHELNSTLLDAIRNTVNLENGPTT